MNVVDRAKELATLIKKLDDIDLYRKIVELEGEIIELTRQNRELGERVEDFERSSDIINKLTYDPPFYVGDLPSDLYCSHCIEVHKMPVHLVKTTRAEMRRRIYSCPKCSNEFPDMRDGGHRGN